MKPFNQKKTIRLDILLTPAQYDQLQAEFSASNFKVFSEFLRTRLKEEPIVKRYRNRSHDEMIQELIGMRNELREINAKGVVDEASALEKFTSIENWLIKIYERCDREVKGWRE